MNMENFYLMQCSIQLKKNLSKISASPKIAFNSNKALVTKNLLWLTTTGSFATKSVVAVNGRVIATAPTVANYNLLQL